MELYLFILGAAATENVAHGESKSSEGGHSTPEELPDLEPARGESPEPVGIVLSGDPRSLGDNEASKNDVGNSS